MTPERLAELIADLNAVARRPAMYVGREDPERIALFLDGFEAAALIGCEISPDIMVQERESLLLSRAGSRTNTAHTRQCTSEG